MLGPIGSNIMSIFRLLSPEEIDRYIDNKAVRKVEGTMVASGEEFTYEGHEEPLPDSPLKSKEEKQQGQAEIIPIGKLKKNKKDQQEPKKEEPKQQQVEVPKKEQKVTSLKDRQKYHSDKSGLEAVGILSARTLREIEEERLKEELSKQDSTTAFLIKERQKMRESKRRLIEQHAYKMYQTNAAQEFYESEQEFLDEEEQNDGSAKGILINKNQF